MSVRRLDQNHDMTFGQGFANYSENEEEVSQKVETRLYTLLGEWFLDTTAGVPYLQEIMVKPANLYHAEALIKQCILDTDGILEITEFDLDFNSSTRRLNIAVRARTIYNSIINIRVTPIRSIP